MILGVPVIAATTVGFMVLGTLFAPPPQGESPPFESLLKSLAAVLVGGAVGYMLATAVVAFCARSRERIATSMASSALVWFVVACVDVVAAARVHPLRLSALLVLCMSFAAGGAWFGSNIRELVSPRARRDRHCQ